MVEGNEIVGNNTDDWERRRPGCGCTGGIKFWAVNGADVRGNWVHDNRGAGLWADTNNNDFRIEDNVLEDNDGAALIYETSYNAVIRNNTIRRNNWVEGRRCADSGDNFPFATDLPVRVRWRTTDPSPHRQDRDLPERAGEQLVRDHPVGERRPVLQQPGQHLVR